MRFFSDNCDDLRAVDWYFVPRTDFVQNNAFVASIWDSDGRADGCPVGEMADGHSWRNGSVPPGVNPKGKPCGTADQWAGSISELDKGPGCVVCAAQGSGHVFATGKGLYARQRLTGLGGAKAFGGWFAHSYGCACAWGRGTPVASTPCACVRPITTVAVPHLVEITATACACLNPDTDPEIPSSLAALACGCGGASSQVVLPSATLHT